MTSALLIIAAMLLGSHDTRGGQAGPVFQKQKGGVVVVKDKTKPIRRELEAVFPTERWRLAIVSLLALAVSIALRPPWPRV